MNPVWRVDWTDSASLAERAIARFKAFSELDVEAVAARAELAAAGVSEHRIDALYPANFTAMREAYGRQLKPHSLLLVHDAFSFQREVDQQHALTSSLSLAMTKVLSQLKAQHRLHSDVLASKFEAALPASTVGETRRGIAMILNLLLFHAWAFMMMADLFHASTRSHIHEFYVNVADLLNLP